MSCIINIFRIIFRKKGKKNEQLETIDDLLDELQRLREETTLDFQHIQRLQKEFLLYQHQAPAALYHINLMEQENISQNDTLRALETELQHKMNLVDKIETTKKLGNLEHKFTNSCSCRCSCSSSSSKNFH